MGEAKRRKAGTEWVEQHILYNAYYHWVTFHGGGDFVVRVYKEQFEAFMGCGFDWWAAGFPATPKVAKKLRLLDSPYYQAVLTARYIRRGSKPKFFRPSQTGS